MKKVLVIGSGGRESAICRKLKQEEVEVYCASSPVGASGNLATSLFATNVPNDNENIIKFCKKQNIDLVIPGGEEKLEIGIEDLLKKNNILCCGPDKESFQLEGNKLYTRILCKKNNIPSPNFLEIDGINGDVKKVIKAFKTLPVLKKIGLCSGKGVFLCKSEEELTKKIEKCLCYEKTLILEERLNGIEASLFFVADGNNIFPLITAMDYKKRSKNEDINTGGMGSVSPHPFLTKEDEEKVYNEIVIPIFNDLKNNNVNYKGFLYAGVIKERDGSIKLLEFNCRLGDPETQVILPRIKNFYDLCYSMSNGTLSREKIEIFKEKHVISVVLSRKDYSLPEKIKTNIKNPIKDNSWIKEKFIKNNIWIDVSGINDDGYVMGGRVINVVCEDENFRKCRYNIYNSLKKIDNIDDFHFRKDIGYIEKYEKYSKPVQIVVGSNSDIDKIQKSLDYFDYIGVEYDINVLSAHRDTKKLLNNLEIWQSNKNIKVIMVGAGLSAALGGICASNILKPVIAIPLTSKRSLNDGLDALLSITQMPDGVPLVSVGVNSDLNASMFVCRILSSYDKELRTILFEEKYAK